MYYPCQMQVLWVPNVTTNSSEFSTGIIFLGKGVWLFKVIKCVQIKRLDIEKVIISVFFGDVSEKIFPTIMSILLVLYWC